MSGENRTRLVALFLRSASSHCLAWWNRCPPWSLITSQISLSSYSFLYLSSLSVSAVEGSKPELLISIFSLKRGRSLPSLPSLWISEKLNLACESDIWDLHGGLDSLFWPHPMTALSLWYSSKRGSILTRKAQHRALFLDRELIKYALTVHGLPTTKFSKSIT